MDLLWILHHFSSLDFISAGKYINVNSFVCSLSFRDFLLNRNNTLFWIFIVIFTARMYMHVYWRKTKLLLL